MQATMDKPKPLVRTPIVVRPLPCTYVLLMRVGNMEYGGTLHVSHKLVPEYQHDHPEEEGEHQ